MKERASALHPQSHLLLVEDDTSHAELVRRAFTSFSEFRLSVVHSVTEARALLQTFAPDLVIADLGLPDGRGIDLVPASRAAGSPVIIMTSQGGESIVVEAMKSGALDYVVKSETTFVEMPHIAARALAEWGTHVERQRQELELAQRDRELRDAQKMEALGRLAGGIAHDFNNVLMGIIGCADIALTKIPASVDGRSYVLELKKSAIDAAATARRLLAFSRGDAEPLAVEIDAAVRASADTLRLLLSEQVRLDLVLDAAEARAELGAGELEQMLMSLAINSRDAMPHGGSITISSRMIVSPKAKGASELARVREEVMLVVSDTGEGMDEATRERAFEPFFTTKGPGKGTGLGLSSVYGFVTRSGGRIELSSTPGVGTTVRAYLPLSCANQPKRASSADQVAAAPATRRTVLLVEDEECVRASVRHYLERAGHEVIATTCAEEAREYLDAPQCKVDLLLSDVAMPGQSGIDLAHHARATRPMLPVVLMSGHAERHTGGATRWPERARLLRKPFSEADLLDLIARTWPERDDGQGIAAVPQADSSSLAPNEESEPCLLLVEDDALCRLASHELLAEAGFRVLDAATAARAREVFANNREIDVLVTDLGLPDCSGSELAAELRSQRADLGIVVLSGRHKSDPQVVQALRAPRTTFFSKPLQIEQVAASIRVLAAQSRQERTRENRARAL